MSQNKNRDEVVEPDAIVKAPPKRIKEVKDEIESIRKTVAKNFFVLGDLLKEIKDGGYHLSWGYSKFGEWLAVSGLDMSERAAYYLIQIIEMGKVLDIPRRDLEKMKLSKLREIARTNFADPSTQRKVRKLLDKITPDKDGNEMPLDEVREAVQKIIGGHEESDDIDVMVYITLRVPKSAKENVIDPAIEAAKAEYGDTVDKEGNPIDIGPGKAIEMICADYLAGLEKDKTEEKIPVEGDAVVDSEVVQTNAPLLTDGGLPTEHFSVEAGLYYPPAEVVAKDNAAILTDPRPVEEVPDKDRQLGLVVETSTVSTGNTDAQDYAQGWGARPYSAGTAKNVLEKFKLVETITPQAADKPDDDPAYQEVRDYLESNPEASVSLLMSRFRLGESRASRLRTYIVSQLVEEPEELDTQDGDDNSD